MFGWFVISIKGYLYRNEFRDLIRRAMYGVIRDNDGARLTRLVLFNQLYVARYLNRFARKLFESLHGGPLRQEMIFTKGMLKDAIVERPPYLNERIAGLIFDYKASPGRFYRETPCRAMLFFRSQGGGDGEEFVGSWRIKRIRRLAEKAARKIIDWIFDAIKGQAERLAEERAARLSIPRQYLLSSPEEMLAEFLDAEGRFIESLREHRETDVAQDLAINDVAGIKVLLEDREKDGLLRVLDRIEGCEVLEEERHAGRYNATNLLIRLRPTKEEMIEGPLLPDVVCAMEKKGWKAEEVGRCFADFVMAGEEEVCLEIIVSNYEQLLESEIGRCMHEDRIIAQRLHRQYRGHLAKNVEYLMRFLFLFPLSDREELLELPIRLWDRYLPDYFDSVIADLFHIPQGDF